MTLTIPDWCKIGLQIEWKSPHITGTDRIINGVTRQISRPSQESGTPIST